MSTYTNRVQPLLKENKALKDELALKQMDYDEAVKMIYNLKQDNLKILEITNKQRQKLEKIEEFRKVIDKGRNNNEKYHTDTYYKTAIDTILLELKEILESK